MVGIGLVLATFVSATLPSFGDSHAAEIKRLDIPVAYALLLDGKDAIYGQATCQIQIPCQLIDNQETRAKLSLTIDSKKYFSGEIRVDCGITDCSFANSKAYARLEGISGKKSSQQFDLYAGRGDSVETYLVYRKRTKIGRILFLFGKQ